MAKGLAEGRVEGLQAMQRTLVNIVSTRFPDLAEQEAAKLKNVDALALLIQKIATEPDEKIVRRLLSPSVV